MTPLSHILSDRSDHFSFTDTLERVEQEAKDAIVQNVSHSTATATSPTIELSQIKQALLEMKDQIEILVRALDQELHNSPPPAPVSPPPVELSSYRQETEHIANTPNTPRFQSTNSSPMYDTWSPRMPSQKIVSGVFNGQQMVGEDGISYEVPANYASKSKMVEGDLLKLTITADGRLFYKQIGPVERVRIVGELSQDPHGNWVVIANMKPYRVLTASVTFHKARQGDQVAILIPDSTDADWGAVDMFL